MSTEEWLAEYTPLERPTGARGAQTRPAPSPSSGSDSDSDSSGGARRPKRRRREAPSRFSVWCGAVREDALADSLVGCDVHPEDRSRLGVETYKVRQRESDGPERGSAGGGGGKGKRSSREERRPRVPPASVTDGDSERDVAADICDKLREEKHGLVLSIVRHVGKAKALELFEETRKIEDDGGMIVRNGTRRRTPGGVFIFLLKRDPDVDDDTVKRIFAEERTSDEVRNPPPSPNTDY